MTGASPPASASASAGSFSTCSTGWQDEAAGAPRAAGSGRGTRRKEAGRHRAPALAADVAVLSGKIHRADRLLGEDGAAAGAVRATRGRRRVAHADLRAGARAGGARGAGAVAVRAFG